MDILHSRGYVTVVALAFGGPAHGRSRRGFVEDRLGGEFPILKMKRRNSSLDQIYFWLELWRLRLNVAIPVRLQRISHWEVTGDNGRRGCSLVGIYWDEDEACLLHTRSLTEEDIVHELLHVAHPCWSEEEVVEETKRLLRFQRTIIRRFRRSRRIVSHVFNSGNGTDRRTRSAG
jgi:hypothetical protein